MEVSMSCYVSGDLVRYWEENMNALGFWVPSSSYDAFGGISSMIGAVAAIVETNPGITLRAAFLKVGMTTFAVNLAALTASAWVGAAIGSMAVATGRSLSCGATIADALWIARDTFAIYGAWLEVEFRSNPQFLKGR